LSRPHLTALFVAVVLTTGGLQVRQVSRLLDRQDTGIALEPGTAAPVLGVARLDGGGRIGRDDLAGRVVIVTFWASWCLPCRAEMPELVRFVDEWNRDAARTHDALLVAVNLQEDPEDIRSLTDDPLYRRVLFGLDPEGDAAGRWRASALPSTFVLDPDGIVLDAIRGYEPGVRLRIRGALGKHRTRSPQ
jgi:thiol-disulfide isomerase/thioredoxin